MKGKLPLFLRLTLVTVLMLTLLFLPAIASAQPATVGPVLVGQGIVANAPMITDVAATPSVALTSAPAIKNARIVEPIVASAAAFADTGQSSLTIAATTATKNAATVHSNAIAAYQNTALGLWQMAILVAFGIGVFVTVLTLKRRRMGYSGGISSGGGSHIGSSVYCSVQRQAARGLRFIWFGRKTVASPLPERKEKG